MLDPKNNKICHCNRTGKKKYGKFENLTPHQFCNFFCDKTCSVTSRICINGHYLSEFKRECYLSILSVVRADMRAQLSSPAGRSRSSCRRRTFAHPLADRIILRLVPVRARGLHCVRAPAAWHARKHSRPRARASTLAPARAPARPPARADMGCARAGPARPAPVGMRGGQRGAGPARGGKRGAGARGGAAAVGGRGKPVFAPRRKQLCLRARGRARGRGGARGLDDAGARADGLDGARGLDGADGADSSSDGEDSDGASGRVRGRGGLHAGERAGLRAGSAGVCGQPAGLAAARTRGRMSIGDRVGHAVQVYAGRDVHIQGPLRLDIPAPRKFARSALSLSPQSDGTTGRRRGRCGRCCWRRWCGLARRGRRGRSGRRWCGLARRARRCWRRGRCWSCSRTLRDWRSARRSRWARIRHGLRERLHAPARRLLLR